MDTIEQLLQRGQQAQGGGVSQVGSSKWHTQHEWIERLNLQAHYNAQTHSDEFVVELLVSLDKLHVLIHDLLLIEAWKELVYPHLASHLADKVDSVTSYLLIYHEVTVANLLQVALYHSHAAESLSEDYALEVGDWCSRKLTRLNAEGLALAEHKERTAEELMKQSKLQEQEDKRREAEFAVLMCSLAILRYVTDALPRLPMGALSRVVSTNDTLMGLLPLLDRPPWVRTRVPGGGRPVLEKWAGNRWAPVAPADRLKITQTDGQVWLAVTNLLVEPRCRAKYALDEYRRERILGLRRHLNEIMFDQLPVLKDLQRCLDELALGVLPDQGGASKASLILEAVPVIRDAMLRGRNWRQVAERSKEEHFGRSAQRLARERIEAMVKNLDLLCELEPETAAEAANSAASGAGAEPEPLPAVKISTWRKVHESGVFECWHDFAMEVDDSRPPEPVEVAAGPAPSTSGKAGGTGGGAAPAAVQGLRYRLRPLDVDATRALPTNGKAVVRWGSLVAEALLQLPELPTRDSAEGAPVLWVTVGLLAVDGLVLQVKLKKAPKPKERDRVAGVWYAYHPVAGALTVLRGEGPAAAPAAGGGVGAKPQQQNGTKPKAAEKLEVNPGAARPLVQVVTEALAAPAGSRGGAKAATSSSSTAMKPATEQKTRQGASQSAEAAAEAPATASQPVAAAAPTAAAAKQAEVSGSGRDTAVEATPAPAEVPVPPGTAHDAATAASGIPTATTSVDSSMSEIKPLTPWSPSPLPANAAGPESGNIIAWDDPE
ncbi:hypothetical protein GPECTOR_85g332 [Gonium pectorale]|uniref:Uncharacterized protein n=1 Tax=Gonium pectorale TaxID=33097 RepID=A0A150G167_GONPE|nr:hypothetical protein GPECTOR_85g332 [Gonium pectorale]|eukprot:KXZ43602.1 hypothetical protein GPECTOR_85g332 [Gonium pectorale]